MKSIKHVIGNLDELAQGSSTLAIHERMLSRGDEIGDIPPYAKKDGMTFDGYYNVQNGDLTGLTGYFKGFLYNKLTPLC